MSPDRVSRRQFKLTGGSRQLKVELPWTADYIIVTNPNTQRLYVHSGSGEFPNKTNYDLMFPGQAKSQDGVESAYFGLTLGESGDNANTITETTVVVFVRGGSISAFGSMPIAPLATVSLAPGTTVGIQGTPDVTVSAGVAVSGNVGVPAGVAVTNSPAVSVPAGVGIVGTPNVAVPGGVGINGTPNVAVPAGVGIVGTPNVALPGGAAITNTPNVALPGGAVVSGTVTNNPVQLSGVFFPYTQGLGVTGPTQFNEGWYDLAGWGGAIGHFENAGSTDFTLQWYSSPNAGGTATVVKSWTIPAGLTFVLRVPKIDRYVLFAVVINSGSIVWNSAVRATEETVYEPAVQTIGGMDWSKAWFSPAVTALGVSVALAMPNGYDIMGFMLSHDLASANEIWLGMGSAGLAFSYYLWHGWIPTQNNSGWIGPLSNQNIGGVPITGATNNNILVSARFACNVMGTMLVRRRLS